MVVGGGGRWRSEAGGRRSVEVEGGRGQYASQN